MSELLQFMYQGEVNVKQAELQAFMSIAESLQIKGLATNNNGSSHNNNQTSTNNNISKESMNSSYSQFHMNAANAASNNSGVQRNQHNQHQFNSGGNHTENHRQTTSTPLSSTSSIDGSHSSMKGNEYKIFINSFPFHL
jgi:hypothetical protein